MSRSSLRGLLTQLAGAAWAFALLSTFFPYGCTTTDRQKALDASLAVERAGCLIVRGVKVKGEAQEVCATLEEVREGVEIIRGAIAENRRETDAGTD